MRLLKCGVIGVGYLGRFHAQKYAQLPEVNLVGVCDSNPTTCDQVALELHVAPYYDYKKLCEKVEAVSIAATTLQHYTIAKYCITQGIHVLIEKPITETVEQADELIYLARKHQVKLQVGHLERFNPVHLALENYLDNPLFIESQRLAPYTPRGADVNVILDLMIHDIDIIQSLIRSPIKHIDAHGSLFISSSIDIANARIIFENQCVANITASRISHKTERKMRIFQKNAYLSVDYLEKRLAIVKKEKEKTFPGAPNIQTQEITFEKKDALLDEITSFIHSIKLDTQPLVSGREGRDALSTAAAITGLIQVNVLNRQLVDA